MLRAIITGQDIDCVCARARASRARFSPSLQAFDTNRNFGISVLVTFLGQRGALQRNLDGSSCFWGSSESCNLIGLPAQLARLEAAYFEQKEEDIESFMKQR